MTTPTDEALTAVTNLFLGAFPGQWRFGRKAVRAKIRQVMQENNLTEATAKQRIQHWRERRKDMPPWELATRPPSRTPEPRIGPPAPADPKPVPLGSVPIPDAIRRRTRAILHPIPYDLDDL